MKPQDGVPELIVIDERSRRETVELCGQEREGFRCTRDKGHGGVHEVLGKRGPMRWETVPG